MKQRRDFASFEAKGLRIAVLAYAVTKNSNMLLDYALSEQTVRDFAATHDIVIVSFHGGAEGRDVTRLPFADEEYYDEPRGDVHAVRVQPTGSGLEAQRPLTERRSERRQVVVG